MPATDEPTKANSDPTSPNPPTGPARVRVCLITTEFHGLFKNGGIGTANTGLALALAEAGFDVTVAFADSDENGPRVKDGNFAELKEKYRPQGITLDFVPASPLIWKAFDDPRSASYCVYLYLKQHEFDLVYFNDCGGHGYYSLLAKHLGVLPNPPRMYVVTHGPHEWVLDLNSMRYWDRWPVVTSYQERHGAAMADALISPSQYLVDWMKAHGWDLPAQVMVIPNIVRLPESATPLPQKAEPQVISEVVFFGRLEVRKGLELFCDAIDLLNQAVDLTAIRITFMGKFSHVVGLHSGMYVAERARRWRSPFRILCKYGQEEALAYLNRPGVLAVIPSLAENSPCVVAECLQLGLPFIATDSGGTAELVAQEDRDLCLTAPKPAALAAKLGQIVKSGHRPARSAISSPDTLASWLRLSDAGQQPGAAASPSAQRQNSVAPLVSICLTHSGSGFTAKALVESVLQQNYPRLEIILVDEEGVGERWISAALASAPSAKNTISFRSFAGPRGDRGAARNAAAAQARGKYLVFIQEDAVTLLPDCVATFVAAAERSGADILTGVPMKFRTTSASQAEDGPSGYFPIGACVELGAFENCFGKGIVFMDRHAFERSRQFETCGDPQVRDHQIDDPQFEDWLFLASSVLAGLRLEVVPELLLSYRMERSAELSRSSAMYNYRRLIGAYSGQKIEVIKHIIETMASVDRDNEQRLREFLAVVGFEAREIALRVSSSFESNQDEALQGLVQYLVERHRVQEALDFAFYNGRQFLSTAIGSATRLAETLALDSVRGHTVDIWHEAILTDDVRANLKSIPAFPAVNLVQLDAGVATHSVRAGVTVLKAAATCPPGARSVRAVAVATPSAPSSVSFALVVAASGARLRLSEKDLESSDAFWWSGWIPAAEPGEKVELSVPVSASDKLLDILLMCQSNDDGDPDGRITWTSVGATISVNDTIATSGIVAEPEGTIVPREVLDRGILLTEHSDFPFPVYLPGPTTLVHPLRGRVSLVRVPEAVTAGTAAIRSVVSIEHAEARPVEFAVWVRSASNPATKDVDFGPADSFSGWFSVRDHFRRHRFTVKLSEPAREAMDLYLATRVVEHPDVHYCHSVWHELLLLE